MFVDQKDAKRMRELERQQERREKHLLQMDATKKMYIDQILQRNAMCDNSDTYQELMESEIFGSSGGNKEWTREEMDRRRQANEVKHKRQQDLTYFDKLSQVIEIYKDTQSSNTIAKL